MIRCVIECFTFLRMGGETDRIDLVPLHGLRAHEVPERFQAFDVNSAHCSAEETTQLLLGVIESGFGDLQTFNSLVRGIFSDKLADEEDSAMADELHALTRPRKVIQKTKRSKVLSATAQVGKMVV